jgi:hypothetical protein
MRYGLSAAIIEGISCPAPGGPALIGGERFSNYLLGSREIAPLPGLYFEDDVYFYDFEDDDDFHGGRISGGVKPVSTRITNYREFDQRKRIASLPLVRVTPLSRN